jgi:hypothetical protein
VTHTVDRDSLAAALRDLFPFIERERWPFTLEQATDAILAALPSPEPTLDVERLANAIEQAVDAVPRHAWHDQAAAIAAEYARLAETSGEPR